MFSFKPLVHMTVRWFSYILLFFTFIISFHTFSFSNHCILHPWWWPHSSPKHVAAHILTYSVVQSHSWEANWFAASQEIPRISRNPEVHYRTHTSWRSILILSTHLRLGLPSDIFPSGFPTKTLYTLLSTPFRTTCPAHLILIDFITCTILGEEPTASIN